MTTPQIARTCWSLGQWPALSRLKASGQFEARRPQLIAAAEASLRIAYPQGDAPAIDFCNALELAAEKLTSPRNSEPHELCPHI